MKTLLITAALAAGLTLTGCSAEAGTYYKNCDAAEKAGATPLHKGDAGYRKGLDRDGDGVACGTDK